MTSIKETDKIIQNLKELGVSPKEAKLYLAALTLGESGMSELSRFAGLKRTSAYVIFEALEAKGLLASYVTTSGKRFTARSPKFLLEKSKHQLEVINEILPELEAILNKKNQKPKITYYEGTEQYVRVVEECLLKPNTIMRHIGSLSEGHRVLGKDYDLKHFAPERIKKNIFLKSLYFPEVAPIFKDDDGRQLREIRYLPKTANFKTLTLICGNKVIITTSKEDLVVVVIESEEFARAEEVKFDLIWDLLKK